MINFLNQSHYNYLLIGILGLLVGWLISKLLVNKHWEKRYEELKSDNESYLTLLDESDTHKRSYDKVVKKLSSQLALLNSDNRTLAKAFSKLQAHRNTLESQLDTSASLFKETKQDNIELKDKNLSLIGKLDIAVKEQKSFKELEGLTTELQQKLITTVNNNKETESILKNLKASHDELWQEYRLLQDDMSSQSAARTEIESQERKQLEKLNAKINEISSERDQLIVNAQKHIVDTTEIKKINEKVHQLEKEGRKLNATIIQQQQELETFTDLPTKLQSLEDKNSTLSNKLVIEEHNSKAILGQNQMLQNTLLNNESKDNESTNQKNKTVQEEIKRHEDYLLKSETRWARQLNALNLKMKSERNNYSLLLQKAKDETLSTDTKLVAMTAQLEKAEANLQKNNSKKINNETRKPETSKPETSNLKDTNRDGTRLEQRAKKRSKNASKPAQKDDQKTVSTPTVQPKRSSKPKAASNPVSKNNQNTRSQLINKAPLKARLTIDAIKGVGVVYAKRLKNIKVDYVDTLLSKGNTAAGRKSLSTRTDIDEKLIETWVGQADLLRVEGINANHAELLEKAGINSTTALCNSNASNLSEKLVALSKKNELSVRAPTKQTVASWKVNATNLSTTAHLDTAPRNHSVGNSINKTNIKNKRNEKTSKHHNNKLNQTDELTIIKGIGKVNEKLLHSLGIKTFAQIANFTMQDEIEVGQKLSSFHNRISKENWAHQAAELLKKN